MIRISREGSTELIRTRLGLFFLAAAIWIVGAGTGNRAATGVAIVIAAAAMLAGFVARWMGRGRGADLEADGNRTDGQS